MPSRIVPAGVRFRPGSGWDRRSGGNPASEQKCKMISRFQTGWIFPSEGPLPREKYPGSRRDFFFRTPDLQNESKKMRPQSAGAFLRFFEFSIPGSAGLLTRVVLSCFLENCTKNTFCAAVPDGIQLINYSACTFPWRMVCS